MSKYQLPTEEDLQRLYDKRGYEAVITYAYRNALRALPFLVAENDLIDVWEEKTVEKFYGIVWGLLLIRWVGQQNVVIRSQRQEESDNSTKKNVNSILNKFTNVFSQAYRSASASVSSASSNYTYAYLAPVYASAYTYYASTSSVEDSRFAKISASTWYTSYCVSVYYASDSVYDSANKDFKYLQQGEYLPSLWHDNKPKEVVELEDKLINQLTNLGLDFLANDIECLWQDKPLGEHAINYTKIYSDTITNNVEKLRRAIVEGIDTEKLTATRVLLLGAGGAGKTTLADRLNNEPISKTVEHKSATIGINYNNHTPVDLEPFAIEQEIRDNLQLYLWDFGGQSIFHGLHHAFLHENCVYVVVVDSRHEQAPDEWLYQIQNLVGDKKPPVLIVTNIYEKCNLKQNQTRLLREFDDLLTENSFYYFPCNNPQENHQEEFDKFINQLVISALKNQRDIFSDMITIKNSMAEVFSDRIFIAQSELIKHIKTLKLNTPLEEEKTEDLMEDLRSLGFIVRLKEKSDIEQYCLKPEWTVDNAYFLLHCLREQDCHGLATAQQIDNLIASETSNNTEKLLDFLIDRKLCYFVGQDKNKQYFFPDASSTDEPSKVKKILGKDDKIQFRFDLPYMPLGLHAHLVSAFFQKENITIQSSKDVWREGFILNNSDKSVQAVVSYYYRKSYIAFTYTGNIRHATTVFEELHQHISNCFQQTNNPQQITKTNIFTKILKSFKFKNKVKNDNQTSIITSSIISNDDKPTYILPSKKSFSKIPKFSYKIFEIWKKWTPLANATIGLFFIGIPLLLGALLKVVIFILEITKEVFESMKPIFSEIINQLM